MAQTAKKVNFMVSDNVRKEFERLVPPGERSKIVNEALRKELNLIKRERLTEKLLSIRAKSPSLSTDAITGLVRKNRARQ